jgi:hypothetical protein
MGISPRHYVAMPILLGIREGVTPEQLAEVARALPSKVAAVVDVDLRTFVISGTLGATAEDVNEALRITSRSELFLGNPPDLDAAIARYDPLADRDRGR